MAKRAKWTEAEDRLIRENPGKGPSWEGWPALLPNRTPFSIQRRRQILGVQFDHCGRQGKAEEGAAPDGPNGWTGEQQEALLRCALDMTRATGHCIQECMVELARIVREHRGGTS